MHIRLADHNAETLLWCFMHFLWDSSQCWVLFQCKITVHVQQFYLALICRSQSMSMLSRLCRWEPWDGERDSDWLRSADDGKARNTILPLWASYLAFSTMLWYQKMQLQFLDSFPGAVTPGCPLSLIDLQSSYYRLDINKELGQRSLTDTLVHHAHALRMGPFQEQECSIISDFPFPNWDKR